MSPLESFNLDDCHDFSSFPPTVQRKYFSSLERLRIARKAAAQRPKTAKSTSSSSHGRLNGTGVPSPLALRPTLSRRNSSYFKNPGSLWLRKTPSPTSETFSLGDAQWYQSLPPKVQQRHFTQEERTFLSGHNSQAVIRDAADQRLYQVSRSIDANRSVPSLHSAFSTLSSRRSSISTFEALDDMDDAMMDTLHCLDHDDGLDLASTLDDYHRFYAPKPSKRRGNHHPSFRKVMSLSSIPFTAANQEPPPPLPTKPAASASPTPHQPNTPTSPTFRKDSFSFPRPQPRVLHKATPSTATLEPSATHYQDPSARLKLRVFLASPQKFDEAIEFGFPSMEDAETRPLSRPSLSARRYATAPPAVPDGETFLDDSAPSVFDALDANSESEYDDEDDEIHSLPERNSPYTPSDSHFVESYLLSPSVASQPSTNAISVTEPSTPTYKSTPIISKPTIRRDNSEPLLSQTLAGNREMTLRMTLTRPDLRAEGDNVIQHPQNGTSSAPGSGRPSKASERDPFVLDQLPEWKEKAGMDIWDTLPPVKENGLRKMWRKVSGK